MHNQVYILYFMCVYISVRMFIHGCIHNASINYILRHVFVAYLSGMMIDPCSLWVRVRNKITRVTMNNNFLSHVGRFGTDLSLRWRHNRRHSVSNHQPHHCLLKRLFRRRSKKTSKLRVIGLCVGTGEFPALMASKAENVSIWWRHHVSSGHKLVCKK